MEEMVFRSDRNKVLDLYRKGVVARVIPTTMTSTLDRVVNTAILGLTTGSSIQIRFQ